MGRPKKGERVTGPYPVGDRYRLTYTVLDKESGEFRTLQKTYDTEQDALDAKAGFESALNERMVLSVGKAIEFYIEAERPKMRPDTLGTVEFALKRFFPDQTASLSALMRRTRQEQKETTHAAQLYQALIEDPKKPGRGHKKPQVPLAAATHQSYLRRARTFMKWCVEQGYIPSNPLAGVKTVGQPDAGKPQMSRDDGKRWTKTAHELAARGDAGALAALLALLLGVRQSEVTQRRVGDIDNVSGPGPLILRIRKAKTRKGIRDREVPLMADAALRRHIAGRDATEWLFPWYRKTGQAEHHKKEWMRKNVMRICRLAGVSEVCSHSLRGLHSTLAIKRGMSPHQVADELGHESFATTREHYLAPGTLETASQEAVTAFLGGQSKLLEQLANRGLGLDKNGNLIETNGLRGPERARKVREAAKKRRKNR